MQDTAQFKCPISLAIMLDPVNDKAGETYEREEIKTWFEQCKKASKPFTTPHTNEVLEDDGLIPARKIKSQITQLLATNPKLWADVYLSKSAQERFKDACKKKDKKALAVLVNEEPRLLTHNFELVKWIISEQDLSFLRDSIIPNLSKRGQKDRFSDVILLAAETKWRNGLQLLIASQGWTPEDYFACAKTWIHGNKIEGLKALLYEMQQQKIALDTADLQRNTLLHEAAATNYDGVISLLLAEGIDSNIRNQNGLTAEEIATQQNHAQAIQAFKAFYPGNTPIGMSNNPQIKALQTEIQELKYYQSELRAQAKKEIDQLSKGLRYAGSPIFAFVKQKAQKKYFTHVIKTLKGDGAVTSLYILADGCVAAATGKNIAIWDIKSGKCLKNLTGHNSEIFYAVVLPNNSMASISESEFIIWDLSADEPRHKIKAYQKDNEQEIFGGITLSSDNKIIVSSYHRISTKQTVNNRDYYTHNTHSYHSAALKVWDIQNGKCLNVLKLDDNKPFRFITTLPDGAICGTSGNPESQNTLEILDIKTNKSIITLTGAACGNSGFIKAMPDGRILSTAGSNVKVWDSKSGQCLQTLTGHTSRVSSITISPDGYVITSSDDKTIKVWDIKKRGEEVECMQTLTAHRNEVYEVITLPDGSLISASKDTTIKVWELNPALRQIYQAEKTIAEEVPECKMM